MMKLTLTIAIGLILIGSLQAGTICGTVYYGMTQNTAEGATVVIYSRTFRDSVYSNSSGNYMYSGLDPDVYQVYAHQWVEETQTLWWSDTMEVDLDSPIEEQDLHMMEVE